MDILPDWSNKTILVVDDEEINCFFFKSALKETKANLLYAINGDEAVDIVLSGTHIDCILMDIRLPKMNGFEATKKIKMTNLSLPIVVQTAYALSHERKLAYEAGCDAYITKPIKINVLIDVLKKFID